MRCFDQAAAAFGWSQRKPQPGAMRAGEWLIGWGCASAAYHASIGASTARVSLTPQGNVRVETAAHDIGTGAYTIIAMTAADRLGVDVSNVTVEIGDSDLPPAGLAAGVDAYASVCNVVAKACNGIRDHIARGAVRDNDSAFSGSDPAALRLVHASLRGTTGESEPIAKAVGRLGGIIEVYAENVPPGAPKDGAQKLYHGQVAMARGSELNDEIRYSFGAQFVEVRVHARTREIRVPRAVGAFAAGTIVNPVTAQSQLRSRRAHWRASSMAKRQMSNCCPSDQGSAPYQS